MTLQEKKEVRGSIGVVVLHSPEDPISSAVSGVLKPFTSLNHHLIHLNKSHAVAVIRACVAVQINQWAPDFCLWARSGTHLNLPPDSDYHSTREPL